MARVDSNSKGFERYRQDPKDRRHDWSKRDYHGDGGGDGGDGGDHGAEPGTAPGLMEELLS